MPLRKQAPSSPKLPVQKKPKTGYTEQSNLGSFIVTPARNAKSRRDVVSLVSDGDEDDDDLGQHKPVASTSKLTAVLTALPVTNNDNAVIDLDDLRSSSEDEVKTKVGPRKAPLHPLFNRQPKREVSEDKKPTPIDVDVQPPNLSKGKARAIDSPIKLVIAGEAPNTPDVYPLDEDIFAFEPTRIDTATWPRTAEGKIHIPYSFLTAAFVLISATRARLIITTVLTNALRTVIHLQPEVLRETVYLITNHVAPAYEGIELGIGSQVLGKALRAVSSVTGRELKQLWNKHGDVGDVMFEAKANVRTLFRSQPLTVASVYNNLVTLTGLKGTGTVNKKADIVQRMLVAAKGEEVRFLGRTLVSHLRIGAVRLTVTASLARAFCLVPAPEDKDNPFHISLTDRDGIRAVAKTVKEGKDDPKRLIMMSRLSAAEALVREVYVRHPNYDSIVPALLRVGLPGISDAIPLSVGTPLSPMLGQITRDLGDVTSRLESNREFAAEWKYDGQRVQIHCERRPRGTAPPGDSRIANKNGGGQWAAGDVYVRLFSRHLEDMTAKYPDILALMPHLMSPLSIEDDGNETGVQSFIIDAEIVAIDPTTSPPTLLTFQTLANRARKDVNIHEVKVKVGIYAFDLMFLNGRTLINNTFRQRRSLLKSRFPKLDIGDPTIARWDHVKCMEGFPNNLEPIRQFMLEAISQKCEGLMLKLLDSVIPPDIASEGAAKQEEIDDDVDFGEADEEDEAFEVEPETTATGTTREPMGSADAEEKPTGKKTGRRKALLATYEPDKRVESWLKVKRDYGDLGDSIDVVPVGAWHGQGRKASWWSPILLAVYNPETGGYQALCKCISGFTDQFYKDLNLRYAEGSQTCSRSLKTYVDSGLTPDVWWEPSEVWEIRGADLTLSPVHTAALGLVSDERGLSLRFPRFIKLREDKCVEQATTPEDLAAMYRRQSEGHKHPADTNNNRVAREAFEFE